MVKKSNSVLVVGFNIRPLAYSLNKAGYEVFAVDFFGDLDLYPSVTDCLIVIKQLNTQYNMLKEKYHLFLADFTFDMLRKYPQIENLIIGSGLDDAFEEREKILKEIDKNQYYIRNLNNSIQALKKARNIEYVYGILTSKEYKVPLTLSYEDPKLEDLKIQFPFVMKKKTGAGGVNVYKIEDKSKLSLFLKIQETKDFKASEWLIQEYMEGIPVSCTTISNGKETLIISINRQIIGEKFVNTPKEFMYCGNVVPANLFNRDKILISEISQTLANELKLRGINGFDFVLKDHYPYLMEINPRIPGSIRVSESALNLNLLDLHIKSFDKAEWKYVKEVINAAHPKVFATKLIMFAPKDIDKTHLMMINNLEHVHDKSELSSKILKGDPICTVLFKGKTFSESYYGALKIIDEIKRIIG
ncbi:MAG: ATP-grasp domain-containing protein [Promethearchaeota archaeon]